MIRTLFCVLIETGQISWVLVVVQGQLRANGATKCVETWYKRKPNVIQAIRVAISQ